MNGESEWREIRQRHRLIRKASLNDANRTQAGSLCPEGAPIGPSEQAACTYSQENPVGKPSRPNSAQPTGTATWENNFNLRSHLALHRLTSVHINHIYHIDYNFMVKAGEVPL
jgi:hypothetical protein